MGNETLHLNVNMAVVINSVQISNQIQMLKYKVRGVVALVVGVSNLSLIVQENILQQQASHFDFEMH